MKLTLDRVNTVTKRLSSGELRTYYYHRDTGKRILGEVGSLKFMSSYEDAGKADAAKGDNFDSLMLQYQASVEFDKLAPNSKGVYRRLIDTISEKWGNLDLDTLQDRRIKSDFLKWRDEIALGGKAPTAQMLIVIMQRVLSWSEKRGLIEFNRLARTENIYSPNRADKVWEPENVRALFNTASPEICWAVALALVTLQRRGDLIGLEWPTGDVLRVKQEKTKAEVFIPITGTLEALLGIIPKRSSTILTSTQARPWKPAGFRGTWYNVSERSGINEHDLHFHDLRGTAISCLADNGATEAEIAALSGHTLPGTNKAMKGYIKRTTTQAGNALRKLQNSWIGQLPTMLQTEMLSA